MTRGTNKPRPAQAEKPPFSKKEEREISQFLFDVRRRSAGVNVRVMIAGSVRPAARFIERACSLPFLPRQVIPRQIFASFKAAFIVSLIEYLAASVREARGYNRLRNQPLLLSISQDLCSSLFDCRTNSVSLACVPSSVT